VIDVAVEEETTAAAPPKVTVAPAWNAEPVRVTDVPPAAGPFAGATDTSAGGGGGAT
jgi:hypothetical protein